MTVQERIPPGVDASRPSVARVYDCLLGGDDNFAVDQHVVARMLLIAPEAQRHALNHRTFLWRVVHFLAAEAGIRQFLDIGSGLPSRGNIHEAARHAGGPAGDTRVLYVDNDPLALVHGRALLEGDPTASIIDGDIRRPEELLASPQVRRMIESGRPVALTLLGILHHLTDTEDPAGVAAALRAALPPGSHLAISHFCLPSNPRPGEAEDIAKAEELLAETVGTGRFRRYEEVLGYFGNLEMVEPGLVPLPDWRPSAHVFHHEAAGHHSFIGGVART